jgi:hypothetical protein
MPALSKAAVRRVGEVFVRANLGDPRRVRRAVGLAENLARAPQLSLPKVWATDAELEAGYQFLRNPRTGFCSLMEAVQMDTRAQALKARRVLVLHDTTDVTCPSAEPEEVGFLQTGKAGFFVHHAFCVSADAENRPFGMLWSQIWGRAQRSLGRKRNLTGPELAKLEERESDRWLESISESHLWAEGCEQVVHVMDREADSFRLFEHMKDLGADFVVRLRHDRATDNGSVSECLVDAPLKLQRLVELSVRRQKSMPKYLHQGRPARTALLSVRCEKVEFQPLNHMPASEPLSVNVVQVLEENPPTGQKPVAWVLVTSLPIGSAADVERIIDIYRARWQIEELHKALKTGCMFEKRQLESFESVTTLLALCYPIACELLLMRSHSRQNGQASDVLRASLLVCLRLQLQAKHLPVDPSLEQALAVIAKMGGHIKWNGPPGWQSLAAGYSKLLEFERGWLAAKGHPDF